MESVQKLDAEVKVESEPKGRKLCQVVIADPLITNQKRALDACSKYTVLDLKSKGYRFESYLDHWPSSSMVERCNTKRIQFVSYCFVLFCIVLYCFVSFQMHTANLQLLLGEHGVMGSSPILAQCAGSSVGRARTRRKMHLVYIAGWSSRQLVWLITRRSLVRIQFPQPDIAPVEQWQLTWPITKRQRSNRSGATKGCSRPQNTRIALTRICKLNYHFLLEELSLVTSCGVCGLAENAI